MPPASGYDGRAGWLLLLLPISVGLAAGAIAYTFRYAEGLSYFSTDPRACVNCHIMQPQYDGWQNASHHAVAKCIDCHLPTDFFAKYLAKAENGWRHGEKFTTQKFSEPIFVQPRGREILQANCVRCHDALTSEMRLGRHSDAASCLHCHGNVGHGERAGLGGPLTAHELHDETRSRQ